ncbi:spore coat protein SP96-like [Dunckerocampus dactyliophorus]|uniref:spore coat protein SP96-like n=1 Tax=Dunckerocampus dactyliophorus TaxID=161453 RepID=UPI002406941E|nr:spore coat protein SP96-like [Dunckerocampus dactyliophorus]
MEKASKFVLSAWFIVMTASCTEGQTVTACPSCTSDSSLTQRDISSPPPAIASTTGRSSTLGNDGRAEASTTRSHLPSSTSVSTTDVNPASSQPTEPSGTTRSPGEAPSTSESSPSGTNSPRTSATTLKAGTCSLFRSCSPMLVSVISIVVYTA